MRVFTGKSILNGIAIGPVRIYCKKKQEMVMASALTLEQEWARFKAAQIQAQEQLVVLDGYNHCVYLDPAPELLASMGRNVIMTQSRWRFCRNLEGNPM